ncbi:MAG: dihydropteroate synthase [Cyanobacteria bacterium P01_D01_bin.73]
MAPLSPWQVRNTTFDWTRTYLMGVLNVTPDSFSDGGRFDTLERAIAQAHKMVADGADILDIGGQSTRPDAETVSLEEELRRVVPVVEALRAGNSEFAPLDVPTSVDTTRAAVAEAAIAAGADMVNDVSGGTYETDMLPTVARLEVPVFLMHLRGTPKTMQKMTDYDDLIDELLRVLGARKMAAVTAGIRPDFVALDPGIGFAKTVDHNLEILRRSREFQTLKCPILIGPSRKSFIGKVLNQPDPMDRVWGTGAACAAAIAGGAQVLRVHDVAEMAQVSRLSDAILRGWSDTAEEKA